MAAPGNNCYLDANTLIYSQQEDSPFHQQTIKIISRIVETDTQIFISPLCLDEFIFNFPGNQNHKFQAFKKILKFPNLNIINPPTDTKSQTRIPIFMKKFDLGPRDAYHLLTMKHHKIKYFATFDRDFDLVFASKSLTQFLP